MSEKSEELKTVKIITFNGDESKWREWYKKVQAFANVKGWAIALTNENDSSCTEKMRKEAMNFLMMALTDKAFAFVENANSPQTVWEELFDEYEPCEDIDKYEVLKQFQECKLQTARENPTLWFKRLETINERLRKIDPSQVKDDEAIKLHIRVNLPEGEYSELITTMNEEKTKTNSKELKRKIKSFWRRFTKQDRTEQEEQVLQTNDKQPKGYKPRYHKQFKGRCRICGKYGHKASSCFQRSKRWKEINLLQLWEIGAHRPRM